MIKRIFSSQSQSITGAAIILGAASFISRLIGILRDRLFAHYFGVGDTLDIYYAAFRIPDFIFNLLIVGALSAGFIPVFLEAWSKDKDEAWRITNSILNAVAISMGLICLVLFFITPQLLTILVPGFSPDKITLTATMTRIMLLSPIILGLSGVVNSVLMAFKNFLIFSLCPVVYNIGIIIGTIVLAPRLGITGLAWGVIIGAILHLIIQAPMLFAHGFTYRPVLQLANNHVKKIWKLTIPRTLGLATQQLNFIVTTIIGSTLASGSIAIFNFANNLQYFPIGIIGHSFSLAAFPAFATLRAEGKIEEMINQLSRTVRQILFLILPITIIFLLLRAQIVRVVLGSGKFDWTGTVLTADTLAFFTLSLFAQSLILLLTRAFYALTDTWTPFVLSLMGVAINVIASLYFKTIYGVLGLAIAFSLAAIIQFIFMWLLLHRKLGSLREVQILHSLYKICIAAIIMAIVIQSLKKPLSHLVDMTRFWGVLSQGLTSGTIGLLTYSLVCQLLHLEEMALFQKSLKRRWLKLWNVTDTV